MSPIIAAFACVLVALGPLQEPPAKPAPSAPVAKEDAAKPSLEVRVPTFPNVSCPIMGKPISAKLYTDTDYGRIYICCKSCIKKIKADAATAYRTAYPTTKKADNRVCPVTGEPVQGGESPIQLQGYEVALCCEECVAKATENAQVVLALALDPQIVDVGNKTCPVTGEPVTKNAFCIVGDALVHLSSKDCVAKVEADPRAILDKAKQIAGDAKAGRGADEKPHDRGSEHDGHRDGG